MLFGKNGRQILSIQREGRAFFLFVCTGAGSFGDVVKGYVCVRLGRVYIKQLQNYSFSKSLSRKT